MANIYKNDLKYMGKTHASLMISEGNNPAQKYVASSTEAVKFNYAFGPRGNTGVVIPKGKILTAGGLQYEVMSEQNLPAVKIANATDIPLGVNGYNVYETLRDVEPSDINLLTRQYIRVPLFADGAQAAAIQYGAATGDATLFGKYVKADAYGNFIAANPATESHLIVGQCLAVETDVPPAGFLQYFMEMTDGEFQKFLKDTANVPSPGRTKGSGEAIDTFPTGTTYLKDRAYATAFMKNYKAGIPFLTDGYFKARVNKTYKLDTAGVKVKPMGGVTVTDKNVTCADPVGAALFITLPDKLTSDKLALGDSVDNYPELDGVVNTLTVTLKKDLSDPADGDFADAGETVVVSPKNIHVDLDNNLIVLYFDQAITSWDVTITATVLENQVPGIPTGWDFKSNIGEARILLMK